MSTIIGWIIHKLFGKDNDDTPVDVETLIAEKAQAKGLQDSNWKESIVALLDVLGLDSSLAARRKLATELQYQGDVNADDTGPMNIWLHERVMVELAEHGGKLADQAKNG